MEKGGEGRQVSSLLLKEGNATGCVSKQGLRRHL